MQDAMAPTSTSVRLNVARMSGAFAEYAIAVRLAADRIDRDSTTPYVIPWAGAAAGSGGRSAVGEVDFTSVATQATQ